MFVYPETMQTDAVEDFLEADSLQQHLNVMFAPDAPPLHWDEDQHYTRSRLELYYLSYAARPLCLEQLTEVSALNIMHDAQIHCSYVLLHLKLLPCCLLACLVVQIQRLQMALTSCSSLQVLYGGWPQDLKDVAPQRYGPHASKWRKVDESKLLGELLSQPDYVIPGIPVFFIVSKRTDYRERFLSDEIPLF